MNRIIMTTVVAAACLVSLCFGSELAVTQSDSLHGSAELKLIAHRGVYQTYHRRNLSIETCTATRIDPVEHEFIENTIPSIREAFKYGADYVEIDIYETKDEHIVLFHDSNLDCKTDGMGSARDQTLADLRKLDVGFGYTADEGKTYPLRGIRATRIPSLGEVFSEFQGKSFVINQKAGNKSTSLLLKRMLSELGSDSFDRHIFWGETRTHGYLNNGSFPIMRHMLIKREILRCYEAYVKAESVSDDLPEQCRNKIYPIPLDRVMDIRGWPDAFIEALKRNGSRVIVTRVNKPEHLEVLKGLDIYGIMTDKIEIIGPVFHRTMASGVTDDNQTVNANE